MIYLAYLCFENDSSQKQEWDAMTTQDKKKQIQVILKEYDRVEKFEVIKKASEANSDVAVIRYCIDRTFKLINNEEVEFRPEIKQIIDNLLGNDYLKSKYMVFNFNDVINAALHQWTQARRAEINLHCFPFRRELPEDEQRVALVFVEQQINYDRGISFDDLKNSLNDMEDARILKILEKFLRAGLIRKTAIKNVEYYYAPSP